MQVMDDDDPGPNFETMQNTNVYHEPAFPPAKIATWDLTTATDAAQASFSRIALKGNFYNSITSITPMGPPPGGDGPPPPPANPVGKNMCLTFDRSFLTGVVTASEAHHSQKDIGAEDYRLLGKVTNTPHQAINNGVTVQLTKSTWVCTGTSYLTKLAISQSSAVKAPFGRKLNVTVDDDFEGPHAAQPVILHAGQTYTGYITINVVPAH
jgi:hypothetical protein